MRFLTVILFGSLLSSCLPLPLFTDYSHYGLSTSSIVTNEELAQSEYVGTVRVFMTGEVPAYKEVGVVQIVVDSPPTMI